MPTQWRRRRPTIWRGSIARADDGPLKTEMERHAEISRRQKDEIERQLKALGSDTSAWKDAAMRLAGRLEPLVSGITVYDMPKHLIAAHSWEQFEIGAYRSMLGTAEELEMADLKTMCERFIPEEEEMAKTFFEELPAVTRKYFGNTPPPDPASVPLVGPDNREPRRGAVFLNSVRAL